MGNEPSNQEKSEKTSAESLKETQSKEEIARWKKFENQDKAELSKEEWKSTLDKKDYNILMEKGTEKAYTHPYDAMDVDKGYFACKACGNPIYSYKAKYHSGCGWPAFDKCFKGALYALRPFLSFLLPIKIKKIKGSIKVEHDSSHGMNRTEIMCNKCGGHLGHVFGNQRSKNMRSDERHCVNGASLRYVKTSLKEEPEEVITLGGN